MAEIQVLQFIIIFQYYALNLSKIRRLIFHQTSYDVFLLKINVLSNITAENLPRYLI